MGDDDGAQATINMRDAETYRAQIAEREAEMANERASEAQQEAERNARYDEANREWESSHQQDQDAHVRAWREQQQQQQAPPQQDAHVRAWGEQQQTTRRKMYDEYDVPHKQTFSAGVKPAKLKALNSASDSELYNASLSDHEIAGTLSPIGISKGNGKRAGTLSINTSMDVGRSWGALPENHAKPISTLFAEPDTYKTSLSRGEDSGSYAYAHKPFSGIGSDELGGLDLGYSGFNPFRKNPSKSDSVQYRKQTVEGRKEVAPAWSAWRKERKPQRSMLGGTLITTPTGVGKESFGFASGVDIPWWGSESSPEKKREIKRMGVASKKYDANQSEIDRLANAASASKAEREQAINDIRTGKKKNPVRDPYIPVNPNQLNIFAGLGVSKEGNALGLDKFKDRVSNAPLTSKEKHKKEQDDEKLAHLVIDGFTPELEAILSKQQQDGTRKTIKAGAIATAKQMKEPKVGEYGWTEKESKAAREQMYKSPFYLGGGRTATPHVVAQRKKHSVKEAEFEKARVLKEEIQNSPFYASGGRSATQELVSKRHAERARDPYGMTNDEAERSKQAMHKSPFYLGGGLSATAAVITKRQIERKQDPYGRTNYEVERSKEQMRNSPFYLQHGSAGVGTPENIVKLKEADTEQKNKEDKELLKDYYTTVKRNWAAEAFEAESNREDKRLKDKYYKDTPLLKLFTDKFTNKKDPHLPEPYKTPNSEPTSVFDQTKKRFKNNVRAEIRRPLDDMVAGRNARKELFNTRGFWYGGGIQPVGITQQNPIGRFPKRPGAPATLPNPMAHSELAFWGRPLGLPRPLKGRTKGARRKERAVNKRRDSRGKPTGFFDVLFR